MAIKVFIKRKLPEERKAKELTPLLSQMRNRCIQRSGYVSGMTLSRVDIQGESLVISTGKSIDEFRDWFHSDERAEIQKKIDVLIGRETEYEIYEY